MATAAPGAHRSALAPIGGALEWLSDGIARVLSRSLNASYLYRARSRIGLERFTARGRFVFVLRSYHGEALMVGMVVIQPIIHPVPWRQPNGGGVKGLKKSEYGVSTRSTPSRHIRKSDPS